MARLLLVYLIWIFMQVTYGKFIDSFEKCELGKIQTIEWDDSDNAHEKGSLVQLFKELKNMDWPCPIKVKGKALSKTLPVRKWSSISYLKGKCQSDSVKVDIGKDPVFTYFDENTAYGGLNTLMPFSYSHQLSSSEFLNRLIQGPYHSFNSQEVKEETIGSFNKTSFVRYGGKIKKSPCPRLARDLDAYTMKKPSSKESTSSEDDFSESSLFIGSVGVASSFHFDLFDNIYNVVVGSKKLTLVPPGIASLFALDPYPGAHPNARQAQQFTHHSQHALFANKYNEMEEVEVTATGDEHIRSADDESGTSSHDHGAAIGIAASDTSAAKHSDKLSQKMLDQLNKLKKIEITLDAGESVWIPAGWFHEVFSEHHPPSSSLLTSQSVNEADKLNYTASIAITANTAELSEFNRWLVGDGALKLPPGEWKVRRLGSFLRIYIPTLLKLLHEYEVKHPDSITDSKLSAQFPTDWPLRHIIWHSYSPIVRQQLEIKRERFPCDLLDPLSKEDQNLAVELAKQNANRFIQKFRLKLIRLFIQPYLETVLSKFGNKLTNGLNFAESCLLS